MMKFRVFSDLHININKDNNLLKELQRNTSDDVLNVICGDISGNYNQSVNWIKKYCKKALFVSGNHELAAYDDTNSIQEINDLFRSFLIPPNYLYLQNDFISYDDVLFIGCTLFTDYEYGIESYDNQNQCLAEYFLNDFRFGTYSLGDEKCELEPYHYREFFDESLDFIKETIEKYKDYKIVIITHHGCSPKSISQQYLNHKLNASFVSNLDDFILQHQQIKYWIHGHLHSNSDYMLGNTRVICNPLGYINENTNFNSNLILEI